MNLEPIIGLEIHVQLKTKSKMFCPCANMPESTAKPNTSICPICTGHPGTLPVPNAVALRMAVKAALALGCTITTVTKFDRKHYFYPDLPKGYQISQYDEPVGTKGKVAIDLPDGVHTFRLTRLHLEEDAAKLLHDEAGHTLVDFNRAGTPLAEIVTEPDFRQPAEARAFLQELRLIMRTIGVSDADMEKGQMRCDANISLRPRDEEKLYPKTEIKNLNSFKSVERALEYEIKRQTKAWADEPGGLQTTSTRGWDDKAMKTVAQRAKEEAHDYRYFPEPDIPPINLQKIALEAAKEMPELPGAKRGRFQDEYGFSLADARLLTSDPYLSDFTEAAYSELLEWLHTSPEVQGTAEEIKLKYGGKLARLVAAWIGTRLLGALEARAGNVATMKVTPENFAELLALIYTNKVNQGSALVVLETMLEAGEDPTQILEERGLGAVRDEALVGAAVARVVKNNQKQVAEYKAGRVELFNFLLGVTMKELEGKADAGLVREHLKKALS